MLGACMAIRLLEPNVPAFVERVPIAVFPECRDQLRG